MKQKNIINISPLATPYGFIIAEPRKNGFSLRFDEGEEFVRLKIRDGEAESEPPMTKVTGFPGPFRGL